MADFFSEKELTAQIGHPRGFWPLVVLKELVDNALDACEEVGVAPSIKVVLSDDRIEVADNGPGIPRETVAGMLDFSVRVSSREAYVSPTRGAQGNALKTIVATPYVVDGSGGDVEIESRGVRHLISVSFDRIRQEPVISHETNPIPVTKGTRIRVGWPNLASTLEQWDEPLFLQVAEEYAFLNPHLTLDVTCLGDRRSWEASNPGWARYRPSDPTSPHWYRTQDLERLIGAYVVHDPAKTVRAFVAEFKGLTSTVKGKAVLERTGLSRTKLADLVVDGELDHRVVADLLTAMRDKARPVSPSALGVIGRDHLARQLDACGAMPESIQYRKSMGEDGGLPWLVEVAFGFRPDRDGRHLVSGVNFSPGILNPFRELGRGSGLDDLLAKLYSRHDDPVCWVAHLASPRVSYTDRGKSSVALTELTAAANAMVADIESAGKKWAKQRRAEIRNRGAELRRRQRFARSKTSIKDAVFRVLPAAYERAAGSVGKAHQRQIYYPARSLVYEVLSEENGEVEELTSKWFFDCLDEYMALHPDVTADWDVLKDARGSFHEPHTGRRVPLGTLGVRGYLDEIDQHEVAHPSATEIPNDYPTLGPTNRFGAALFIEKEGFHEILNAAQISERYDVAIMSTKGMSTFAARDLKSALEVPVLVARDFDKAGFSIAATLAPDVIDIGLRLQDVEECALESEAVYCKYDPRPNLRANGATEDEIAFLGGRGWGKRVELNAFTSDEFIAWLEEKFEEHGVRKVVPDEPTLADAYRRAVQVQHLNEMVRSSYDELERLADAAGVPPDLEQQVLERIEVNLSLSWDAAIAEIVGGAE